MKIVADQAKMSQKLQTVGAVVPAKTTLTVLSNVLLHAEGDQLRLTATDLDLSMTTSMPAKVEQPGSICIQARRAWLLRWPFRRFARLDICPGDLLSHIVLG